MCEVKKIRIEAASLNLIRTGDHLMAQRARFIILNNLVERKGTQEREREWVSVAWPSTRPDASVFICKVRCYKTSTLQMKVS
jgi:hypothetical protein